MKFKTILISDKTSNILMYGLAYCIIVNTSYILLQMVQFFLAHPMCITISTICDNNCRAI